MFATLDQARALDALARAGTYAAAAKLLSKQHSAVVYAVQQLESQTELQLLDRSGYRTKLTPAGARVLEQCRRLLDVERDLAATCHAIKTGWEPRLRIVMDGLFPASAVLREVAKIAAPKTPTQVEVFAEFLSGVESAFLSSDADLMISVVAPEATHLRSLALPPIPSYLVARRDHPLARARKVTSEMLEGHTLLTVRGSDPRLQLSTAGLQFAATIHLNDFHTKKDAILAGMGFGWLPAYLIDRELERGTLRRIAWPRGNTHTFRAHAYHRADRALGRAAQAVVQGLAGR